MAGKQQHLTQEGIKKFEDELKQLTTVRMEEVKLKLQDARAQGDLSENAEYDAAREEQAEVHARIQELQFILKNAVLIDGEGFDTVQIGSTVTYRANRTGVEETFKIVGSAEANPFEGKISNESPLAKALTNKGVGDQGTVTTPKGLSEVTIIEIK